MNYLSDAEIALSTMREQYPKMDRLKSDLGNIGLALGSQLQEPVLEELQLVSDLVVISSDLRQLEMHQFYVGVEYYESFYSNGETTLKKIQSLIPRVRKNILISKESKDLFLKMTERSRNNLKNEWSVSQNYWRTGDLERLRGFLRIVTYESNRYRNLPETQESDKVQENLSKLSKLLGTLSTVKGFGFYRSGFNNIEHIRSSIERSLKMIEDTIILFKK